MVSDGADWAPTMSAWGALMWRRGPDPLLVRRGILLKLLAGNLSGQGSSPSTSG